MALEGLLFDFDGTLADSERAHHLVWNEILAPYGVEISDAEYKRRYSGNPVPTCVAMVREDHGLTVPDETLIQAKVSLTRQRFSEQPIALMAHATEILGWAREQGLRLALITGSGREELMPTLEHHDLAHWFEAIVTRNEVTHSKPHPESYLSGLEQMQLSAAQAVALEDTHHGVMSAAAAGLEVLAIPNAYSSDHDFSAATRVCESLSEARDWLQAQRLPA
ncbi:HAD superfamily hydrolase (TIGR01509 family) [Kushneria sinocarnis]|uniref:HAD superfamily hydrolase (TIGR01509 family) n=1 Tax=Kushneria sinocarnis TaxID=595502 RepID=A0A420WU23_9GAMM|nr:HAD-IA family hydrolase [Kushneria sinocarnis]RKQ96942.1 HAD superfamily hydrolase (TIGR01509 family) [Kushneria sinocarnis]